MKKFSLILLILFFFIQSDAGTAVSQTTVHQSVKTDALLNILKLTDPATRQKKLVSFIKGYFGFKPMDTMPADKVEMTALLQQYKVDNANAYSYYIDALLARRNNKITDAENYLVKAIEIATKNSDHYLAYTLFTHLAFFQTDEGNTIDAVTSFRKAKQEAVVLQEAILQVMVDINISDIYYRNNFFGQSISFLNQAQVIITGLSQPDERLKNLVYYNKAENYFRMGNIDSLQKYNAILNSPERGSYKIYIFRNRTNYYLLLLQHNYQNAIRHMIALQKDSLYKFDNTDKQNLADAYYNASMPDSAKQIINSLLADPAQSNHPEIKMHLYQVLGKIAEKQNNMALATDNFKMAFAQSQDQINRLTQVGNISSLIKIDEIQGSYIQKEEALRRQRIWLIFTVIVSVLAIAVAAMLYRNIKQKRYYEKLLYDTQKEELAFINSHEVRRHLSNILGIIDMIKNSDNKQQEYLAAEEHMINAAKSLDEAIKNISGKLEDINKAK